MKLLGVTAPFTGSGKTSVTLALLSKIPGAESFKIGPDYIDPGLAARVSGRRAYNIDRWIQGRHYLDPLLASDADYGIIEGVMGFFDSGSAMNLSTHYYFRKLKVPYLLVIDVSRMAESAYYVGRSFFGRNMIGVVLNNVGSEKHANMVRSEFEKHGIRVIATIPHIQEAAIPERHLGLYTASEMEDLQEKSRRIAAHIDTSFLEGIEEFKPPPSVRKKVVQIPNRRLKVAVAYDRAFNFYYTSSLDFLNSIGEVEYFSPLKNEVPERADFVYIGGGYPELYPDDLERAERTKEFLRNHVESDGLLMAECGGLMFLERHLEANGKSHSMAGLFAGTVKPIGRLTLGYTKLVALRNSFLFRKGDVIYGHEFHRTSIQDPGDKLFRNIIGKGIQDNMDGLFLRNALGSYSHFDLGRYSRRLLRTIEVRGRS
ncbi:MAG TPA: cobyrinate a,c-diamide synthase [Thermoplasmataceae archaeon]|nr:cobyrinate a,c-diamide synthase [Thermoplasmatales archaeon AK]HLH86637.1 cobyrinate a,c-diamide synthase [Thermoplasmataceae archaeon]